MWTSYACARYFFVDVCIAVRNAACSVMLMSTPDHRLLQVPLTEAAPLADAQPVLPLVRKEAESAREVRVLLGCATERIKT
jgi:hypothetical protein